MTVLRNPTVGALLLILVVAALGVFVGCSSEKAEDTQATTETAAEETQAATETAAEEAVELASFDNPKEGICPVCTMKVEKGYIEVANVTEKKYACCSAGCVAALTENPDKYLAAKDGHEGHNH
jgi:YHS domain-containing protein